MKNVLIWIASMVLALVVLVSVALFTDDEPKPITQPSNGQRSSEPPIPTFKVQ